MKALEIAEATRIVPASAADIFELLATPARHSEIDGSGTVRGTQRGTPERLALGTKFGMSMTVLGAGAGSRSAPASASNLLGARYKILNEVVEFEEDRRIAWRHFGGHVWRYILEPLGERATKVTEQFDPTPSRWPLVLKLLRYPVRNQRSIEHTLHRLVEWASAR